MDHAREQADELESLQSIFTDELKIIQAEAPSSFTLRAAADESASPDTDEKAAASLQITYTDSYPEVAPEWELIDLENVTEDQQAELSEAVQQAVDDNLGMAMVFGMHAALKDKLDDMCRQQRKMTLARRQADKEEADRKELERLTAGTPVTPESFMAWHQKFVEEKKAAQGPKKSKDGRLTGRQLFETDKNMISSDATLLGEDEVAVDVSVFADMDDIANINLEDVGDDDDDDDDGADDDDEEGGEGEAAAAAARG